MAIFSEYMTLMTALFFLWIQLARGKNVTKWQKRAMVILSIVTPLVYFPMLPAFFAGVAVTLLFRTLNRSNGSIVARLATELKNLSWFMLSIPSFALAALAEPWALGKRPSRDPFFFSTSEFQQTIGGMFQFVNEKTQLLFHELLSIDTGVHDGVGSSLAMILGFLVFVGALYIRFSHNENGLGTLSIFKIIHVHFPPNLENANSDRLFTIFYVGLCLGGTAALSLADLYPYGTIRYGLHLLVPILVLATFGLDDVLILFSRVTRAFSNTLSIPSMSNRIYEACSVVVLVVLLVIIVATSLGRVNELRTERVAMIRENERIRSTIKREDYQLLLYTPDTIRFFQALAPEKLSRAVDMGYGVRRRGKGGYQAEKNTDELRSMINNDTAPLNKVLFSYWGAGTPGENHPEYIEVFPPQTWAITDEARRLDHVTLLSLSMLAIDPLDSKLPTRISRSVFEITEKGTLYLRGWAVSPQVIDRVEVRCNGEALGPVEFPTRRADVLKNVPEYRTEWCGYVLEIPYEPRFSENDLFVEVFSGGVSLGKINIGKVK
ncbi:MAG: hypothetical protein IIB38_02275 [Candidatus Hydrogenedentes bacterium]|nr:hypothetical protein [Candidatus Hydrogenedentota bacterium]